MLSKIRAWETNFTLSKATLTIGFLTLLSRLVGLFRDRLLAGRFGAGDTLDIYYAAFRIPDLVFNLLILGTLSVAFIPIFAELLMQDKKRAFNIANTVLNFSFLLISAVCLILFFFAKPLTHILAPGFAGDKLSQTTQLMSLFLFSPIIFTISNVFSSILNAQKRFFIVCISPILYNFGIIFGLLFLYPKFGLMGLGYGVILGALMHMLIQIPQAIKLGFSWRPIIKFSDNAFKKMAKLFIPRIFGVDNSQISLLIGSIIGSVLASGSITIFNLANNLQAVPIGIFAISATIAIFPALSEDFSKKDEESFSRNLNKTILQILYFIIPITILLFLFRAQLVRLAFGSGKFDWQNTIDTFQTLGIFAFSLFSQSLSPLFSRAFYSRQNTITPVVINFFAMALNTGLAYFLGRRYGVVGVAAGFSISSVLSATTLFIFLKLKIAKFLSEKQKLFVQNLDKSLLYNLLKVAFCSIIMGISGYLGLYVIEPLLNTHTVIGLLVQSAFAGIVCLSAFMALSYYLELNQTKKIFIQLKNILGIS